MDIQFSLPSSQEPSTCPYPSLHKFRDALQYYIFEIQFNIILLVYEMYL